MLAIWLLRIPDLWLAQRLWFELLLRTVLLRERLVWKYNLFWLSNSVQRGWTTSGWRTTDGEKNEQQGPITVTTGYPPKDSFPVSNPKTQINPLNGKPMKSAVYRPSNPLPTVNAYEKTPRGQDAVPRTYQSLP